MTSSFLKWFRRSPIQHGFLLCVYTFHLTFLILLLFSPQFIFPVKKQKTLLIKTVIPKPSLKTTLPEKKQLRAASTPTVAKIPPPPVKKVESIPQTKPLAQKKQTAVKKEPAVADKVVRKEKAPAQRPPPPRAKVSDSLLQELEESIAKMQTPSQPKTVHRKTAVVAPLQIDTPVVLEGIEEQDYNATLVHHLQQNLRLPDYGEVKIQLHLRQDGSVVKIVVLKAESEKNKQYLRDELPKLQFPRFEGVSSTQKEQTFTLTFCNEF